MPFADIRNARETKGVFIFMGWGDMGGLHSNLGAFVVCICQSEKSSSSGSSWNKEKNMCETKRFLTDLICGKIALLHMLTLHRRNDLLHPENAWSFLNFFLDSNSAITISRKVA